MSAIGGLRLEEMPEHQALLSEWLLAGGQHHGPNVETVTMPLADYIMLRAKLSPPPLLGLGLHDSHGGADALQSTFGLSYAHWAVMPRAAMEAMPDDWQGRAAQLIDELFNTFPNLDKDGQFQVILRDRSTGRIKALPSALCEYRHPDADALDPYRAQ